MGNWCGWKYKKVWVVVGVYQWMALLKGLCSCTLETFWGTHFNLTFFWDSGATFGSAGDMSGNIFGGGDNFIGEVGLMLCCSAVATCSITFSKALCFWREGRLLCVSFQWISMMVFAACWSWYGSVYSGTGISCGMIQIVLVTLSFYFGGWMSSHNNVIESWSNVPPINTMSFPWHSFLWFFMDDQLCFWWDHWCCNEVVISVHVFIRR